MKVIKQISTGNTVYRENPHTDKTLLNASNSTKIAIGDLQIVNEILTEDEYSQRIERELPYTSRRKNQYGSWEMQFEMIYKDILAGQLSDTVNGVYFNHIKVVRDNNPKP